LGELSDKQQAKVGAVLGLLLLALIFLLLLDIHRAVERIEGHIKEANDADPHIAHQRELRRMGIHEDPTKDFRP
jgi:hypothetical protein